MSDFCNIKNCENEVYAKGLCTKHYQKYYYRVKKGLTTWQELTDKGIAEPARESVLDIGEAKNGSRQISNRISSVNINLPPEGSIINVIHPDSKGQDLSKREVLEKVKDHLRDNPLDGLFIVIFQLQK